PWLGIHEVRASVAPVKSVCLGQQAALYGDTRRRRRLVGETGTHAFREDRCLVKRAGPPVLRRWLGLEWFYRLLRQTLASPPPVRHPLFVRLVAKERLRAETA
ncbi:MAG: hypothetical protein V3S01_03480, partial [Dehalococcoidia bacterium]